MKSIIFHFKHGPISSAYHNMYMVRRIPKLQLVGDVLNDVYRNSRDLNEYTQEVLLDAINHN